MKIISFQVERYRVLRNIEISFMEDHNRTSPSGDKDYALDFLAGVNGTGKTTVLQILTKLFNTLQTEDYYFPISVKLTYLINDEGGNTKKITVSNIHEDESEKLEFNIDDGDYRSEKIRPEYLPSQVVVYTTGDEGEWKRELQIDEVIASSQIGGYTKDVEEENQRYLSEMPGHVSNQLPEEDESFFDLDTKVLFIQEERFYLVTLCGLLSSIKEKIDSDRDDQILRPVLKELNLNRLKSFSLRIRKYQDLTSITQLNIIESLEDVADQIIQAGADRILLFNVARQCERYQKNNPSIFGIYQTTMDLFKNLNLLYEHLPFYKAPLREVNVFLERKTDDNRGSMAADGDLSEPMLHLLDWLSDGERSFLGRMALFCLFRANNLLIILDEPEVHFNDVWKRELVHILDEILKGFDSHAILSTHSSIALSDVKESDILVFRRLGQFVEGENAISKPRIRTLGADPSDIMVHVFGTQYASGEHSVRYIREKIGQSTSRDQLERLQKEVAPGYWFYRIQLEMDQFSEVDQ